MIHCDYSIIVINCCHIQSSSEKISLYLMGTNTETQSNTLHIHTQTDKRHTHTFKHTALNEVSLLNSSPQETLKQSRQNKWQRQGRLKIPVEQRLLMQQSKPIRNSQKLKQHAVGPHGSSSCPLCIQHSFLFIPLIKLLHC